MDEVISASSSSTTLTWEDLPSPEQPGESPLHRHVQLLKAHYVDEYFPDDKSAWNQDDSGIWLWETSNSSLQFDSSEEQDSDACDLVEFPLVGLQDPPSSILLHSTYMPTDPTSINNQTPYFSDQPYDFVTRDFSNTFPRQLANLRSRESILLPWVDSQGNYTSDDLFDHNEFNFDIISDSDEDLGPLIDNEDVMLCDVLSVGDGEESIWED